MADNLGGQIQHVDCFGSNIHEYIILKRKNGIFTSTQVA